jgi:hypothetical protein
MRGNPIHPGELDVHENEVRRFLDSEFKSLLGCLALYGLVTLSLEHVAHELSVLLVVFDDEDQLAAHLILSISTTFTLASRVRDSVPRFLPFTLNGSAA